LKIGRQVTVNVYLTVTGAGTANSPINVTLPVTAAVANLSCGSGVLNDSGVALYPFIVNLGSTTAVQFFDATQGTTVALGQTGSAFSAAFAAGDTVGFQVIYESAT
jgi:hypothetical protein